VAFPNRLAVLWVSANSLGPHEPLVRDDKDAPMGDANRQNECLRTEMTLDLGNLPCASPSVIFWP
jgi:hypothetical protein